MTQATKIDQDLALTEIWAALQAIPDPEIPVISVTDLGIIRAVACTRGKVTITVTPTYSGCPATEVISRDIEDAVRALGAAPVAVVIQLTPAWTTDWLSIAGRAALHAYGIAPPAACHGGRAQALIFKPRCPRCGERGELLSAFGATPCKALYRCTSCGEPFEYFKPI